MQRLKRSSLLLLVLGCGSVSAGAGADADVEPGFDASCEPETDQAFCERIGKSCEPQTAPDNCGEPRTADCGTCAGGQGCVVGVCQTPVCSSFNYNMTSAGSQFNRDNVQDGINAATPDGRVIVFNQSMSAAGACGGFHIFLADETSPGAYEVRNATVVLGELGLFRGQNAFAITPDGLTLIAQTEDRTRWVTTTRSALHQLDFGPVSEADFVEINPTLPAGKLFRAPVLSADRLEFIYAMLESPIDETFSSVRASVDEPFPPGVKIEMPQPDPEAYRYPTGISSDRLALFVFYGFNSRVLTRSSTSEPFVNPNSPAPPPQIGGWDHKPLEDCSVLVAMSSPGGCSNEDVVFLTRQ